MIGGLTGVAAGFFGSSFFGVPEASFAGSFLSSTGEGGGKGAFSSTMVSEMR
jgi:hypothetical protein